MWNEIRNQRDKDYVMNLFGGFHDSCIKECKYLSGAYVCKDLSMHPVNSERILKIIFQRQCNHPSVIEMEFIGLQQLRMYPIDDNYTCEILDATMEIHDDYICWYDCDGLTKNDLNNHNGTYICSSKVRWRVADEHIGQKEIYTENKNER